LCPSNSLSAAQVSLPKRLLICERKSAGTVYGYQLHLKAGEDSCQACLDAHSAYEQSARYGHDPARLREHAAGLRAKAAIFDAMAEKREAEASR
jgi:hypothetical protein